MVINVRESQFGCPRGGTTLPLGLFQRAYFLRRRRVKAMNAKDVVRNTFILSTVLLLAVLSTVGAAEIAILQKDGSARGDARLGAQLSAPLNIVPCMNGNAEFVASRDGKEFLAPCRFVHETTAHLREVAAMSTSPIGFPLATDHVHLAIPSESWERKYHALRKDDSLPAILRDPDLVAVYHASQTLDYSGTGGAGARSKPESAYHNQQVLGYYDGRGVDILPNDANVLTGRYRSVGWFYFRPHQPDGSETSFDISFDRVVADECTATDAPQTENGEPVGRKHDCV
jgi:hypothetical protein